VWREVLCFNERERAALAWTEALTRLGEEGVPDQVELVELSLVIVAINGWNRLGVAFRHELDP